VVTSPPAVKGYYLNLTGEQGTFAGMDFGSVASAGATVSGTVFRDTNGNGVRDSGEPGVASAMAYLDANNSGVRDPDELTALSSSTGAWSMTRLPAGQFTIRQVLPPNSYAEGEAGVAAVANVASSGTVSANLARSIANTYCIRRSGSSINVYAGTDNTGPLVSSTLASTTSAFKVATGTLNDWIMSIGRMAVRCPPEGSRSTRSAARKTR
jgi:hypothetical protein